MIDQLRIGFYIISTFSFTTLGILSAINLLVLVFGGLVTLTKKNKTKSFTPNVSIIIPVYNEEETIERCLISLLKMDYPKDKIEVICIDDGSTDNTKKIVTKYSRSYKSIKLITKKHSGKSNSLNLGIKKAKYNYITVLDSDISVARKFLINIVAPLMDKNISYVSGRVLIDQKEKSTFLQFQSLEFYYMNLVRLISGGAFGIPLWSGPATCYKRKALENVAGFSTETLSEDFNMILELHHKKERGVFSYQTVCYTLPTKDLKSLVKQRMRWFFGGLQTLKTKTHHLKDFSFTTYYIFFATIIWFLNSIVLFPLTILATLFNFLISPFSSGFQFIRNTTVLGMIDNIQHLNTSQADILMFLYTTISIIFLSLLIISILVIGEHPKQKSIFTLMFYFFYINFLQFCFIASLFYYYKSNIKTFDRK